MDSDIDSASKQMLPPEGESEKYGSWSAFDIIRLLPESCGFRLEASLFFALRTSLFESISNAMKSTHASTLMLLPFERCLDAIAFQLTVKLYAMLELYATYNGQWTTGKFRATS